MKVLKYKHHTEHRELVLLKFTTERMSLGRIQNTEDQREPCPKTARMSLLLPTKRQDSILASAISLVQVIVSLTQSSLLLLLHVLLIYSHGAKLNENIHFSAKIISVTNEFAHL